MKLTKENYREEDYNFGYSSFPFLCLSICEAFLQTSSMPISLISKISKTHIAETSKLNKKAPRFESFSILHPSNLDE